MKTVVCSMAILAAAAWTAPASAGERGTTVDLGGLKATTPASWKAPPADTKLGTFRKYQFALPHADADKEDAELVVFYFGPAGGGTTADNVKRWKQQFAAPPGKEIDDLTKITNFKVSGVPVTYVEIEGTYLSKFPPFAPNAKVTPKEHYRFIGAIVDTDNGAYFLRLLGPARTVEAHKKEFDDWLKALK